MKMSMMWMMSVCVNDFAKEGVDDSVDIVVDVNIEVRDEVVILLDVNVEVILEGDDE